jgi:predicted nuclease of predicted toxin-antitoxin system
MLRLATDEDVDGRIIAGLLLQRADLDLVRMQDVGLRTKEDPILLEWADAAGRILITNDKRTMPGHVEQRINAGKTVPGVFILRRGFSIGKLIEEILIRVECSEQDEWLNLIDYLP